MKHFLLALLFSIFALPHYSFAESNAAMNKMQVVSHPVSHRKLQSKSQYSQPVDINHADAAQLMTLKGIGEKRAQVILAYRQQHGLFQTVNDLARVRGIGEKGLTRLKANNPGRITINMNQNLK